MAAGMVGRLGPCYSYIRVPRRAKGRFRVNRERLPKYDASACGRSPDFGCLPVSSSEQGPWIPKPREERDERTCLPSMTLLSDSANRRQGIGRPGHMKPRPDRPSFETDIPGCLIQELFGTGRMLREEAEEPLVRTS